MRGTRTIWRAGFARGAVSLALLGLAASASGCQAEHAKPKGSAEGEVHNRTLALDAGGIEMPRPAPAAAMPSAIAETLQALHEQRLELAPPRVPAQRLDFGPGRLLQASGDHLVLRDTKQGDALSEANLGRVLALAHGSDGALFALGSSGGARFESQAKNARALPHTTFFPDSILFPDLEQPNHFYVFYLEEQQLHRYPFEAEGGAFLPIEADISLEGCTGVPTELRDGALACRTADGFARKAPRGTRTDFKLALELAQPFRLLPANRLDELYAVARSGEVKRLRLVSGVPVVGAFQLPAFPYAAAANDEALAFILMSAAEPGKDRQWSLLVTDLEGRARLQVELSAKAASAGEDWAQVMVEDKNLALSGFEPLVAVGGSEQVTVWDYHAGKARFVR